MPLISISLPSKEKKYSNNSNYSSQQASLINTRILPFPYALRERWINYVDSTAYDKELETFGSITDSSAAFWLTIGIYLVVYLFTAVVLFLFMKASFCLCLKNCSRSKVVNSWRLAKALALLVLVLGLIFVVVLTVLVKKVEGLPKELRESGVYQHEMKLLME